jgi:pyroglutamyl-peptidase
MPTILITGFGPFPRAPFNPTESLVRGLARERRPALTDISIVAHIFRTSYAAVDRDLTRLLQEHKPDAILMFGLATRTAHLRIETSARNRVARHVDADRRSTAAQVIARGHPYRLALPTLAPGLLAAARAVRVPAKRSRDAGAYLCNYLCWRTAEAACRAGGPRIVAFVHVPPVWRGSVPRNRLKTRQATPSDLARAARAFLGVVGAAARR